MSKPPSKVGTKDVLAQKAENALLALVCLRKHRCRCLAQDLGFRQVGRFNRIIGVFDPRPGVVQVGDLVGQIVHGGFHAALTGTESGACCSHGFQSSVSIADRGRRTGSR